MRSTTTASPKRPLLWEDQYHQKQMLLGGCDEVGRGPLAGPVVAGCCFYCPTGTAFNARPFQRWRRAGVADSKKLTVAQRQQIIRNLGQHPAQLQLGQVYQLADEVFLALAAVGPEQIDQINILQASLLAMKQAWLSIVQYVEQLPVALPSWPGEVLIDGTHQFVYTDQEKGRLGTHFFQFNLRPCPRADQKSVVVALAAIFAKEYRDHYMAQMDELYPGHHFRQNAGYPTKQHLHSLRAQGPSPIHRRSFRGVRVDEKQ